MVFPIVFDLATIAFNGLGPLVKRCDGFAGSLWIVVDRCGLGVSDGIVPRFLPIIN